MTRMFSTMAQRKDQALSPWTPRYPTDPNGRALVPVPHLNGNGYYPPGPNGYPPNYTGYPTGPRPAPSMLESLVKLFFARWSVLILIAIVGAVGSYLTVQKYGKQSFSIEGVMTYSIPDDYAQRRIFTPPKLETIMQLVKSPEVIEPAIKETNSPLTVDLVMRQLRVQNVQMSDNLAVTLDTSEKEMSGALVNRIMELAKAKYLKDRNEKFEQALSRVETELKSAEKQQNDAGIRYRAKLAELNVGDPKQEYDALNKEITELTGKINDLENLKPTLEAQIETLKAQIAEQSKPADPKMPEANEHLTQEQQATIIKHKGDLEKIESQLRTLKAEYARKKQFAINGVIPLDELRDVQIKLDAAEKDSETLKKVIAALEKRPEGKGNVAPIVPNDPLADFKKMMNTFRLELAGLPIKLNAARAALKEKKERLQLVAQSRTALEPLEQANGRAGTLVEQRTRDRAELEQFRSKIDDPTTSELKIRSAASGSPSAVSSNYLKITAAVFGLLFLLYGAYLAAFELPRVTKSQTPPQPSANGVHPGQYGPQPHYGHPDFPVPVLGHFAPMSMPAGRYVSSPPPQTDEVHTLANGLASSFREPGSIVLFTPMGEGVQVEKLVSELSRHYAGAGESVLLFDARGVSTPLSMAMTGTRQGAIDSYLDGNAEDAASCFTPTQFASVEYTRGDISQTATGGAMAMYRFRQLLDEMRNRYSKVLMIGPTARHVDDLEMLTAFSEGVVLVVQDQANPNDVNAYVEAMKNADAPIFGAVVVGNPMR